MELPKFLKSIDPEDTRDLLGKLIRSKSLNPPGDVRECAAVIVEELKRRKLPAETIEEKPGVANVVSGLDGQADGKTLIWNGHFDVVPPGEDWQSDPFSGEYREGYIYGRGASDMKSGLAAMIIALDALKKAGAPFRGRIVLQAVGDEETGSDGGTLVMIRRKIVTAIIIVRLASLITLPMSYGQTIDEERYGIEERDGWRIVRTDVFTVAVPSIETIPMFIWWHNDDNSTLYVAKYEGLAEAWLFTSEQFSHSDLFDDMKGFKNEFMVRAHSNGWIENPEIVPKINEVSRSLHPFFLPFSQGKWELTPIQEIKAKDGTLVGPVSYTHLTLPTKRIV